MLVRRYFESIILRYLIHYQNKLYLESIINYLVLKDVLVYGFFIHSLCYKLYLHIMQNKICKLGVNIKFNYRMQKTKISFVTCHTFFL